MTMSGADSEDHDQRLKVLLKEFFEQFFLCFFPVWAARFDFSFIDWLDKELDLRHGPVESVRFLEGEAPAEPVRRGARQEPRPPETGQSQLERV